MCLNKPVVMVDGKFGTGKTTIIRHLIHNFDIYGLNWFACSPTGKAAARITEVIGRDASTIHFFIAKLYGYRDKSMDKKDADAGKDEDETSSKQRYDVVIIDEFPMVNTELFYRLIVALKNWQSEPPRFILIGDQNQLQPIDWGCLMLQLLKSGRIPVATLTVTHRFKNIGGGEDGILLNTHAIVAGTLKKLKSYSNFIMFDLEEKKECLTKLKEQLITVRDSGRYCLDDIIILSPINEYLNELNILAQSVFYCKMGEKDKSGKKLKRRHVRDLTGRDWFEEGSIAMMNKNRHDIGVMNGQTGKVMEVTTGSIVVDFGVRGQHEFKFYDPVMAEEKEENAGMAVAELDASGKELTTALLTYGTATTIHKGQGSEKKLAFFFAPDNKSAHFMYVNLVITALTRGTDIVVVIGDLSNVNKAIRNKAPRRQQNLALRLQATLPVVYESSIIATTEDTDSDSDDEPQHDDFYGDFDEDEEFDH